MNNKPFTLKFDKTPTMIYIQHENVGIGELYLDGKPLGGLQEIEIKAESKTGTTFPELKLKVVPFKLAKFGAKER